MLVNAQCGACSEDCAYCAQSKVAEVDIDAYPLQEQDAILTRAERAAATGVSHFSIVTSGRGPGANQLERIARAVTAVKQRYDLRVCASLGIMDQPALERLAAAGLDRYHHNLNTSAAWHPQICTTHTWDERVATVKAAQAAGLETCSGVIVGMGEDDDERVQMMLDLRRLAPESIPVNFLHPVPGTPLADKQELTPARCLKILCAFRFACPDRQIRVAGGREHNLGPVQPLIAWPADSMFVGDLLTTAGAAVDHDCRMLQGCGFEPQLDPATKE